MSSSNREGSLTGAGMGPALLVLLVLWAESIIADWFVDRAAEAGLDFRYFNGMSGELYFVENVGGGAR